MLQTTRKYYINNTYLMYRHLLCRNRILLGPFGSPTLFSTTSSAILRGMGHFEAKILG